MASKMKVAEIPKRKTAYERLIRDMEESIKPWQLKDALGESTMRDQQVVSGMFPIQVCPRVALCLKKL